MAGSAPRLLALALTLLLPLSGVAGIAAPAAPCPGDAMAMAEVADMDHSCCDHERSARLGYKVCKPGFENCQAPVLFVLTAPILPGARSDASPLDTYRPGALRANAESFWRPPRV